jgi:hypothetical protein
MNSSSLNIFFGLPVYQNKHFLYHCFGAQYQLKLGFLIINIKFKEKSLILHTPFSKNLTRRTLVLSFFFAIHFDCLIIRKLRTIIFYSTFTLICKTLIMDFQHFLEYVPFGAKLPAMAAHIKMVPFERTEV